MTPLPQDSARILSSATNMAVVQLPGRQYPGLVIPGDSLAAMVATIRNVQRLARGTDGLPEDHAIHDEIADLAEALESRLSHYQSVCADYPTKRPLPSPPC